MAPPYGKEIGYPLILHAPLVKMFCLIAVVINEDLQGQCRDRPTRQLVPNPSVKATNKAQPMPTPQ